MLSLMNRTLPSARQTLTPPVCLLRDWPVDIRVLPDQPVPCNEHFVGLAYLAGQNSSSSPNLYLPDELMSPSRLFGVGLVASRPALTMLELGKPSAHTPRGSRAVFPARNSAT